MRLNSAKIEIDSRLKLENVTHNMVEHMLTSIFAIGFQIYFLRRQLAILKAY